MGFNSVFKGLILYLSRVIVSHTQFHFQQTARPAVLTLVHVSSTNRSLLQPSTVPEDMRSVLRNLSALNA